MPPEAERCPVPTIPPPYATNIDDHPRQSIVVATVNDDQFLKDATGNRRFWVIDCPHNPKIGEVIDIDAVVQHRDAIWKAAVLAYRSGRLPLLSREQQNESDALNGSYERRTHLMLLSFAGSKSADGWRNPSGSPSIKQ